MKIYGEGDKEYAHNGRDSSCRWHHYVHVYMLVLKFHKICFGLDPDRNLVEFQRGTTRWKK